MRRSSSQVARWKALPRGASRRSNSPPPPGEVLGELAGDRAAAPRVGDRRGALFAGQAVEDLRGLPGVVEEVQAHQGASGVDHRQQLADGGGEAVVEEGHAGPPRLVHRWLVAKLR